MDEQKTKDNNDETAAPADHGQVFFSWQFPEFPRYERSRRWYVGAAISGGLLLLFAAFTRNFLFAIITIIAALTITLIHRNPRQIRFQITEDGLVVNDTFFDYDAIKNFYIIYQPPEVKTLYFELKSFFKPRIPAALEDQDPAKIRAVLTRYLTEDLEREHEPVSDQFSRLFKL
ncbi:MAG: hypothetical protein A3J59_03135 [Candidatus Buchananbacteria bacterium RIFCSPHIGHO2_02_FULL_56_16]|uniref:Uncharacterized protein n=1 Tax=Candidatus Buchananbacteria bacterium RIFCSPHIGHO2_02_FULL_56_16 TaxID=1797542 RepID=A0A1G1YFL6_9BACT|nr:MAG: hypothetical protein A3J59_03135 [Candidatus Buchananbacteria bacterium RIFCSPHIGHO2_02_FULL_56_16]